MNSSRASSVFINPNYRPQPELLLLFSVVGEQESMILCDFWLHVIRMCGLSSICVFCNNFPLCNAFPHTHLLDWQTPVLFAAILWRAIAVMSLVRWLQKPRPVLAPQARSTSSLCSIYGRSQLKCSSTVGSVCWLYRLSEACSFNPHTPY